MTPELRDLRASVGDRAAFSSLDDYLTLAGAFLAYLAARTPTRIVSPSNHEYVFYQYGADEAHRITRPLNQALFVSDPGALADAFGRFVSFLHDLRVQRGDALDAPALRAYAETNELNRVVYTLQQSVGCVADSFPEANQARKRVGQLFENLVKLVIREVGLVCEPRIVRLPVPGHPGVEMRYELDVVFSRDRAVLAAEIAAGALSPDPADPAPAREPDGPSPAAQVEYIADHEIVGSVKTTSKDRIDKVFLDKYLLTKLLGRDVPVVAVFLHDVQRASTGRGDGRSLFGVASTFKAGHFLGYTVALNRLDGVYYVDPRPEMRTNPRLGEQIKDFQAFLTRDIWLLSGE